MLKIHTTCVMLGLKNFTINKDMTVSVNGDVFIPNTLEALPFKFDKVSGDFYAAYSLLTDMTNMPNEVGGSFNISYSKIGEIEGMPRKIGGDFIATDLTTKNYYTPYPLQIRGNTYISMVVKMTPRELSAYLNYQHYYDVFDKDGNFQMEEARALLSEIKDGLL